MKKEILFSGRGGFASSSSVQDFSKTTKRSEKVEPIDRVGKA
jgi:hypothetical protein